MLLGRKVIFSASLLALSGAPAVAAQADWTLVWEDTFDGDALDRTRWTPEVGCWGGGNNERQCYTDRPQNIEVRDGILFLKAQPETFTGPTYPEGMGEGRGGEMTREYTSGKVRTLGLHQWQYGRFSARMKLPEGQGTWPAFWMMPSEAVYGRWPLSGEIDIMEAVNLGTPCAECPGGIESRTSGALHFGSRPPENTYLFLKTDGLESGTPADDWHVYTLEWAQDRIQWLVDGKVFMRIDAEDWYTTAPAAEGRPFAPFDQPFYLMLNYAVGGNLAEKSNGAGFDPSSFPSALLVDWVRVEACDGDRETGKACLTQSDWNGEPQGPWETQAR